jgi:hypothetical protein
MKTSCEDQYDEAKDWERYQKNVDNRIHGLVVLLFLLLALGLAVIHYS